MEILIDWKNIHSEDDFYDVFLPQVAAPEWHGRNLDALNDSVVSGGVNKIEPPYTIRSLNTGDVAKELVTFQLKVLSIFNEALSEGRGVVVVTNKT